MSCAGGQIRSDSVAEAFRVVPRHLFVPATPAVEAYRDVAIPTKHGPDRRPISSSSQPAIMAVMLEQLDLRPGRRVLEIGTGTGYNAALLAQLVGPGGSVTTVDIDPDLVDAATAHLHAAGASGVAVVCGDGVLGYPDTGPYDRIIVTAGAWEVAPSWVEQLAPSDRLVLPLSLRGPQRSVAFEPAEGTLLSSVSVRECGFMPLRGTAAGSPETVAELGAGSGAFVYCDHHRSLDGSAIRAWLDTPSVEHPLAVAVTAADVFGSLGLWLALTEPDHARLAALGAATGRVPIPELVPFPGYRSTVGILGCSGIALLAPGAATAPRSTVLARGFGADGGALATRLAAQVRSWHDAGRPATTNLHIDMHPPDTAPKTHVVIDKHHSRLAVNWD